GPHRRSAVPLALLDQHDRVRARGRRPERPRSHRFPSLAVARRLGLWPPRRRAPIREHDRRGRDHRPHLAPWHAVPVRPLRPAARAPPPPYPAWPPALG